MALIRESTIENALKKRIKNLGGWGIKLLPYVVNGLPDRLVLLPGGRLYFVELKAPGKKPRPTQVVVINKLKKLGFTVLVIDSVETIETLF